MAPVGLKGERGQSLVELAIALPLLLIILVGIVDVGRVLYYAIALETGAREGAAFAATFTSPNPSAVEQRVCDATGLTDRGASCDGLDATLAVESGDSIALTYRVDVRYDVPLLFGQLLGPLAGDGTMHLRASATYPGLTP